MHEMAIVSGLIRLIERQAALHDVDRVVRATVKVGRLRAVEPQQLHACFAIVAEGTIAEGAALVIDTVAVRGRCQSCGREFDVPRFQFQCPDCGSGDVTVVAGQELYLESFEAAAPDPGPGAAAAPFQEMPP